MPISGLASKTSIPTAYDFSNYNIVNAQGMSTGLPGIVAGGNITITNTNTQPSTPGHWIDVSGVVNLNPGRPTRACSTS